MPEIKDLVTNAYHNLSGFFKSKIDLVDNLEPNQSNMPIYRNIFLGIVWCHLALFIIFVSSLFAIPLFFLNIALIYIELKKNEIELQAGIQKTLMISNLLMLVFIVLIIPGVDSGLMSIFVINLMNQIRSVGFDNIGSLPMQVFSMAVFFYMLIEGEVLLAAILKSLSLQGGVPIYEVELMNMAVYFGAWLCGIIIAQPYLTKKEFFSNDFNIILEKSLDGLRMFVFACVIRTLLLALLHLGGFPHTIFFQAIPVESVWYYSRYFLTSFVVTAIQSTCEEIMFRGLLKNDLQDVLEVCQLSMLSVPLNGFFFSLCHGLEYKQIPLQLLRSFFLFILGATWTHIAQKEGGIEQTSVLHCLHNFVVKDIYAPLGQTFDSGSHIIEHIIGVPSMLLGYEIVSRAKQADNDLDDLNSENVSGYGASNV